MIRQEFDVAGYWKVVVYYDVNYRYLGSIAKDLGELGITTDDLELVFDTMESRRAKAVTYSSTEHKGSVVLFNTHSSKADYLNSIVHEAEHVKQAMLKAYQVEDKGEPPAYTVGYLVGRMWGIFKNFFCEA